MIYRLHSKILIYVLLKIKVLTYRLLSTNKVIVNGCKIVQPIYFCGRGSVELDNCSVGIYSSPGILSGSCHIEARAKGSKIKIGRGTIINNNATIIAEKTIITIGDSCMIGPNFFCVDSDFHPIKSSERSKETHECRPVKIGNNVLIGYDVKVLKGVTIGDNSVLGAGAVVVRDVKPNSVYAGNPAILLKSIE